MSVYMTEEEQLEQIKNWWNKYGSVLTLVVSLVLLSVAGYRYMQWHNEKIINQASVAYENMMIAFSRNNTKNTFAYANQLTTRYAKTVYSDVAHLTLAKVYVAKDKLNNAKTELSQVEQNTKMPALKQVARIRIARIFASEKNYKAALSELSSIDDSSYLPIVNELKGDIYGETGQYKQAIAAYKDAMKDVKLHGMGNLFLEMKSNELAIKNKSISVVENNQQQSV